MMKRILAVSAALLLAAPLAAFAEPMSLTSPRDRGNESATPRDPGLREIYPQRPPVARDPQFIGPLTVETQTGRAGAAGWTSQNPPTGSRLSSDPDDSGWLGLGFAMEWGRSARQRRPN